MLYEVIGVYWHSTTFSAVESVSVFYKGPSPVDYPDERWNRYPKNKSL